MDLEFFNAAPDDVVRRALLACADVPRWAEAVLAVRPYADAIAALRAAGEAGRAFTPGEVERALAAHPRIGDRAEGESTEAAYSRGEQAGVSTDPATRLALVAGNTDYESRFGRVFLICATGLSAEEILASLRARLAHDDATEQVVVADELRKIALLRLRKVLDA